MLPRSDSGSGLSLSTASPPPSPVRATHKSLAPSSSAASRRTQVTPCVAYGVVALATTSQLCLWASLAAWLILVLQTKPSYMLTTISITLFHLLLVGVAAAFIPRNESLSARLRLNAAAAERRRDRSSPSTLRPPEDQGFDYSVNSNGIRGSSDDRDHDTRQATMATQGGHSMMLAYFVGVGAFAECIRFGCSRRVSGDDTDGANRVNDGNASTSSASKTPKRTPEAAAAAAAASKQARSVRRVAKALRYHAVTALFQLIIYFTLTLPNMAALAQLLHLKISHTEVFRNSNSPNGIIDSGEYGVLEDSLINGQNQYEGSMALGGRVFDLTTSHTGRVLDFIPTYVNSLETLAPVSQLTYVSMYLLCASFVVSVGCGFLWKKARFVM